MARNQKYFMFLLGKTGYKCVSNLPSFLWNMIAFGWGLTMGVLLATVIMQHFSENDEKLKKKIEESEYAIKRSQLQTPNFIPKHFTDQTELLKDIHKNYILVKKDKINGIKHCVYAVTFMDMFN